ncbi:MAG: phenylacetate--CoA ligase family protein [Candidatus Krumholzibacteriia bacterium]
MDTQKLIFAGLVYPPVAFLYAGDVGGERRRLEASQRWPHERRDAVRLARLRALLDHAAVRVPRWREAGLPSGRGMSSLADIARLPFTVKADLQARAADFRSTAPLGRLVRKTTGGSTGVPVTIWKTRRAMARELAATWRGYAWAGVGVGDRQARFWGVPLDSTGRRKARAIDWVCNRRRFSAFRFGPEELGRYAAELRGFRPRWLYGYVSMLCELAEHYKATGETPGLDLACIVTTAEVLSPPQRQLLAEVFGTRVFNEYGCGELGTIAHECAHGRLHLSDENLIVEILDGDRSCAPGEMGEIVVTELNNLAMPLLRYRLGDFGSLAAEPCPCGRTLAVLENVYGRAYDFLVDRQGRRFHGEIVLYVFEAAARLGLGVRQFQVVQADLDRFRVRVVPGPGDPAASRRHLEAKLREQLGSDARFEFESVTAIPREKSGKMRLIVGLPNPPA